MLCKFFQKHFVDEKVYIRIILIIYSYQYRKPFMYKLLGQVLLIRDSSISILLESIMEERRVSYRRKNLCGCIKDRADVIAFLVFLICMALQAVFLVYGLRLYRGVLLSLLSLLSFQSQLK